MTDIARAWDSSQLEGNCGVLIGVRSVAFHLENPVDVARNLLGDLFQRLGGADEPRAGRRR